MRQAVGYEETPELYLLQKGRSRRKQTERDATIMFLRTMRKIKTLNTQMYCLHGATITKPGENLVAT
jgi:hypothetical protein